MKRRHLAQMQSVKVNMKKKTVNKEEFIESKLSEVKSYLENLIRTSQMKSDFNRLNDKITGLENFYIQDSKFHIVFNGDSDNVADTNDVIDIEIQNN